MLSHSMALCNSLYKSKALTSDFRPLTHLCHNPLFPPGQDIKAFQWWTNEGLFRIEHFRSSVRPLTVSHCISKLEMSQSERFWLHQIRHFILSLWSTKPDPPSITGYGQWCSGILDQTGGISRIYAALTETSEKPLYAPSWERDLNSIWEVDTWYSLFCRSIKGIANVSLMEVSMKILAPLPTGNHFSGPFPCMFQSMCPCGHSLPHLEGMPTH